MINPVALTKILEQANEDGILCTLLLNCQGSLVAFAGNEEQAIKVKATVASSIWTGYEHAKHNAINEETIKHLLISCDTGNFAIKKTGGAKGLLLCMFSNKSVELGVLDLKVRTLADLLQKSLTKLSL